MLHPHQPLRLLLLAAAIALVGCGGMEIPAVDQPALPALQWESGTFSELPLRGSGDLATYVDLFAHSESYTVLTAARTTQIGAMFDAIDNAVTAMIGGDLSVNWCAAVDAAGTAGYLLGRYYDTFSSRWFIVGEDGAGTGQAYFIINPEPKRDLIVEAPHVYAMNANKLEGRTDTEGVLILRQTLGRALLINGADRCQGSDGGCGGTFSSAGVCPHFGERRPVPSVGRRAQHRQRLPCPAPEIQRRLGEHAFCPTPREQRCPPPERWDFRVGRPHPRARLEPRHALRDRHSGGSPPAHSPRAPSTTVRPSRTSSAATATCRAATRMTPQPHAKT